MRIGEIVRAGSSPFMQVRDIDGAEALVRWIRSDGTIIQRVVDVGSLVPFWQSFSPQSMWPETQHLDLVEIEREERAAAAEKKAKVKVSRKARRSLKVSRRGAA